MNDVLVPTRDLEFLLFDWLQVDLDGGVDRATVASILAMTDAVAREWFLSCNRTADIVEPKLEAGRVSVLPAIADALREYAGLGLCGLGFPEDRGGMGLPQSIGMACHAVFASANIAATGYTMLTAANARLLLAFGSEAQIDHYARPQIEGRWFGTMCLSEPQAGSSLGDIRCRAEPAGRDEFGDHYRLTGNKMWISGGDQNITENIVHLVLAKVPASDGSLPPGTKGISLFIVPKLLADGARNDVVVAGLNHKLGYRGTANCLLNFGEQGGAIGWRVGDVGDGLRQMFKMMNEARIAVGTSAAALAVRSHRHSVRYARERLQGRLPDASGGEPVPLISHPDVRRMLLQQKSYGEGALALCLYCAHLADDDDDDAEALLGLLTPLAKSWPSEFGLIANDLAIQIHGGYGYTRDFDVEQLWRDNRLNPIHEGATAIQGIDLLDRKILGSSMRAMAVLEERIAQAGLVAPAIQRDAVLAVWHRATEIVDLLRTRSAVARRQDSTVFLRAFGHLVIGWLWLELAWAAENGGDADFAAGKAAARDYFCRYELPQALAWLDTIAQGDELIIRTPESVF